MVNGPRPAAGADKEKKASGNPTRFTLKPSKQTCIILGSLMGAVILGGVGLYFWQTGEIAEKEAILRQKNEEVAQGEKIARQLTQLETEYSTMQNQLRFLESSVEARAYAPTMVKQLAEEARRVNMGVLSFRGNVEKAPDPPADKEAAKKFEPWPYDKLHVAVEMTGSYWNVARFLYRLTEFPKIVAVDNVSIQPKMNNGVYDSTLTVRMNLTGFIFPVVESEEGAPNQAAPPAEAGKQSAQGSGGKAPGGA
jgi:Tfp pilus assembly protein PilO